MSSIIETPLEGLYLVEPKVFGDDRGFFCETYNEAVFKAAGLVTDWKQDNWSRSARGILRGLHFQRDPHAQVKLVRVMHGSVFDVAVDVRPNSKTYGKWFGVELSAQNKRALYIPSGFAHGFQALEDDTDFFYKCSSLYHPASEAGFMWNDPAFGIKWPIENPTLSAKDLVYAKFQI